MPGMLGSVLEMALIGAVVGGCIGLLIGLVRWLFRRPDSQSHGGSSPGGGRIITHCPKCHEPINVPTESCGHRYECTQCHMTVHVPRTPDLVRAKWG